MKALLGDINIQGHVKVLLLLLESEAWREVWASLNLTICTFADLGLALNASDADIWQRCQQEQAVLLTGNRNADGPTSLEATIRQHNEPDSLPVFTVADTEQVLRSRQYAERVVERLLDYLLDIDNYRGTGRLFRP